MRRWWKNLGRFGRVFLVVHVLVIVASLLMLVDRYFFLIVTLIGGGLLFVGWLVIVVRELAELAAVNRALARQRKNPQ